MTSLFAYLFYVLSESIFNFLQKFIDKIQDNNLKKVLNNVFSIKIIALFVYIGFIAIIVFAISDIVPKILKELSSLPQTLSFLGDRIDGVRNILEQIKNFNQDIQGTISKLMTEKNFEILTKFFTNIKNVGTFVFQLLLSLILSYVFIVDRKKVRHFFRGIEKGNFSFIYRDYQYIFSKIVKGFGSIFKAQAIIVCINTVLTIIGMYIIGFLNGGQFPYIFTLAIFVFILGFVPILGTFLSSIPIIAIGFSFGGLQVVVGVLIMITFIHTLESYVLNPKIVSSYMELPVFLTFVILIISEHIFGIIGFLVGVPLFYIITDLLKDLDAYLSKVTITYDRLQKAQKDTIDSINSDIRLSRSGKRGE
ncbi:MAG: AI-2E family transporter [Candidatus Gracilibacteria bacterium]|nr:AI-2E family transporter [Candidatus Gracilibacteria bacterium]